MSRHRCRPSIEDREGRERGTIGATAVWGSLTPIRECHRPLRRPLVRLEEHAGWRRSDGMGCRLGVAPAEDGAVPAAEIRTAVNRLATAPGPDSRRDCSASRPRSSRPTRPSRCGRNETTPNSSANASQNHKATPTRRGPARMRSELGAHVGASPRTFQKATSVMWGICRERICGSVRRSSTEDSRQSGS